MPFTFSHPAIVLPFIRNKKKIFSSTGLIVGCMIPDFESFIFFNSHKLYSHTWKGIFWFDLPLAILFSFVFHLIVRDSLIINLPEFFKNKFVNYVSFNWYDFFKKHFVMVIISILIGIFSHFIWDAFTHLNLHNPDAIDSKVFFWHHRLYKILQYANSLLGFIILVIYVIALPDRSVQKTIVVQKEMIFVIQPPKVKDNSKMVYWITIVATTLLTIVVSNSLIANYIDIILMIDIVISGFLMGLIVAPGVLKIRKKVSGQD